MDLGPKNELMVKTVGRLIRRDALPNMLNILDKARAVEVANVLSNLTRPERRTAFRSLLDHDVAKCAEALTELPTEVAVGLLESLGVHELEPLFQRMTPDDAAVFMEELSEDLREELLSRMKTDEKAEVQELLSFPSETAGRIMTPNVFSLDESLTVGDAIRRLQDLSDELEAVFYVYVVDGRNHLVGVVSMRQLLLIYLRASEEPLKSVMSTDVISVRTHTDQEEVTRMVANYNLLGIPVVDEENKLVGIITVDDVIDVIRDEATEDILGLAGVEADDRALGGPLRSFRRRIPWLLVSLMTAFFACYVVKSFEESVLANAVQYAILLPLVAALGGQAATQTLTVIVRGISTGEVTSETRRRAFIKEVLVGFVNGGVLGALGGLVAGILFGAAVGMVIFGSLVVLMVIAALAGTVVPFTLRRLNFDPAIASSVFVITITDVLGFFVYLLLASWAIGQVGDVPPEMPGGPQAPLSPGG